MNLNLQNEGRLNFATELLRRRCCVPGVISSMLIAAFLMLGMADVVRAQTTTFSYTGSTQTYSVAATGTLYIDMAGGQGTNGGNGGRVVCSLAVTAGQVLNINVGGHGSTAGDAGGGAGYYAYYGVGYSGGAASDIRIGGTALTDRVVVAGGGGGGGTGGGGSQGGGTTGGTFDAYYGGSGGTQSAGGAGATYSGYGAGYLGKGGDASAYGGYYGGGGGGGGYYGGGGGAYYGGGGGSSYTHPSLCTGVTHTQGYQSGNGYVIITTPCTTPTVVATGGGYFCQGNSSTLTASGATTYSWAPSTGLSATTGASVSASPTTTTTYTVTGNSSGCTNTATVTFSVRALPSAAFSVTPSVVCQGTSQSFVAGTTLGSCSGNALSFTGNTHVAYRTGVISTVSDDFTMEAWVKFNGATAAYQVIMHNGHTGGNGYGLVVQPFSTGLTLLRGGVSNVATGITLPTSGWHHVAVVRNSGNWAAYLDGVKYSFSDGTPATPTTGFYVGNSTTGSQRFNGMIDEVTFWNVARTESQIQSDIDPCSITTNANLLGYWKFDEGTGSSVADASGNGRTLTVSGAAWVTSGADVPTYTWSFGDGGMSSVASPSHTAATAGTFVNTLTVTDALLCSSSTASATTVNPYPSVSGGSNVTICTGNSTTLTATGATTYTWSPSTGLSATTGASVTANPSSTITYTVTGTTNSCSSTATVTVSVNSTPPASTGQTFTCAGGGITLSNVVGGGSWSSSNTSIATVGSLTGVVTGVAAGTVNITYTVGTGCFTVSAIDVNPPMPAITGTTNVCIGTTTDLDDSMAGGTWSTSSSYFGSVDPTTGVVTGVHPGGYTTVTYSVNSGCNTTASVYTSNIVLSIAGSLTTCVGSTSTLSVPGYPGATWVTPDSATAFINATSGAMLGIAAGTVPVTVNYGYCFTTATASVNPVPASITGGSEVCMGSTLSLACSTGGGAWSSSNTAKATVDGSGTVTGVAAGTATISYALGTGCAATKVVTVGGMPAAISGTTTLCEGATTNLACTSTGGTWSSSATGTADVTATTVTGFASYATISGIAAGGATISYSYPGGCVQTVNVTVAAPPSAIGGTLDICVGGTSTLTGSGGGSWSSSTTTVATIGSSTGIVTAGATSGTSTITYRTSATCYTTAVVTVGVPAAISGASSVCKTYSTTFTHGVGGGTWSSSNAAVASVDASGVVTGVLAGSANITYNISTGCYAVKNIYVYNNPAAITGTAAVCAGANTTLTGASGTTAVWSSSDGGVATVGSSSGVVTGVSAGNADITFTATATGCFSTRTVTVNEGPSAITGASTLCVGADEAYVSTPTGGAWASTAPTVGSINATSGVATGRAAGGTYIKYTLSNGCYVLKAVTVTALPGGITGTSIVCVGNSVVLSAATSGSTWSTSASGTASITATTASTATVAGVSTGVANISYSNAAGCSRVYTVTVNAAVADIAGDDVVCSAGTISLTDATAGGTWSSNATGKVSVAAYTGVATGGATLGTAVITYKVGLGCYATKSITNNAALPNILGGASYMCSGEDAAVTLTNAVSGGTWSSSNTSVAVVDGSGVVTGVLMGGSNTYVYITYATSAGCTKSRAILIKPQPIITGAEEVSVGATTTMTGSPTGGSWGSSSTATAYITGYGIVYGIAAGSATISYTVAGCVNTKGITVTGDAASRPAGMTEEAVTLFSVFPNPSHGSLSVSTGVAGTFAIYTVDGKLAATSELTEGVNAISMPANMASGTYLCRFNGVDGSVQSVRLVYEP